MGIEQIQALIEGTDFTIEDVPKLWPNLSIGVNSNQTSKSTPSKRKGAGGYNCIAWAVGRDDAWIDPGEDTWPASLEKDDISLENIVGFFRAQNPPFEDCEDGLLQVGVEKIAIYVAENAHGFEELFSHVALQLQDGTWTSKLGDAADIHHDDLNVLKGPFYGQRIIYLRRQFLSDKRHKIYYLGA